MVMWRKLKLNQMTIAIVDADITRFLNYNPSYIEAALYIVAYYPEKIMQLIEYTRKRCMTVEKIFGIVF